MSYRIGNDGGQPNIYCITCGCLSYNKNDIEQRYCPRCKVFHHDVGPETRDPPTNAASSARIK